jgi:DNA-binding winged helix-turn-helix (wHTH) protein
VILKRANHTDVITDAALVEAMFEERNKRLDRVDLAIAKIRRLLRENRKREQRQLSLVERAKKIRRSA